MKNPILTLTTIMMTISKKESCLFHFNTSWMNIKHSETIHRIISFQIILWGMVYIRQFQEIAEYVFVIFICALIRFNLLRVFKKKHFICNYSVLFNSENFTFDLVYIWRTISILNKTIVCSAIIVVERKFNQVEYLNKQLTQAI